MSSATMRTTHSARRGLLAEQSERVWVWLDRYPAAALALLALVMLALAVVKLRIDPPSFHYNWENRWWQIALNVARGDGYVACKEIYFPFCGPNNQVTAMREPLPVLLFAGIVRLTGESLLAAATLGVAANVALMAAVFWLGNELAGTRAGLAAALAWTIYLAPIRLFYSKISGDLPAALFLTGALALVIRACREPDWRRWAAAGVLLGLAALSRSAVLAVALALAGSVTLWPHAGWARPPVGLRARLGPAALLALACILTLSPWLARNAVVFGRPVIGSTLSGYYLYRQNHTLLTSDYLRFVSGAEFIPVVEELVARRADLRGNENEAEMDAIYRAEALRVIRAQPLRYLALAGYRFLMLWFNWGVNEVYRLPNTPGDTLIAIQHALLLAGGVAGLRGRWRHGWPLAVSVAAFSLLCMAVMAHLPYSLPVVGLLAALSGCAVADQLGWPRRRSSLPLELSDSQKAAA